MTNERLINNEEMMSYDELDQIAGGTVAEFNEIWSALEKKAGTVGAVSEGLRKVLDMMPGGNVGSAAWRNVAAPLAEKALKDVFGINSYISIGWLGTGFRESGNTYSKNGKGLSHNQVLQIIGA